MEDRILVDCCGAVIDGREERGAGGSYIRDSRTRKRK